MNQIKSTYTMNRWDRMGIIVSISCILHCLLMPIAIIALPMIPYLEASEEKLHLVFAILAIPIAVFSLWRGFKCHALIRPMFFAGLGIALLWIAMLVHEPHWLEILVTGIGASLIIVSHVLNHRCTHHYK